jgi:hypothetical protein
MATYEVFIHDRTRNPSELAAYTPKAQASMAGHPVQHAILKAALPTVHPELRRAAR